MPPSQTAPIPTFVETVGYFRRLVILVRPHWGGLLKSVFLGMLLTLFGLIPPYITKLLIDEVYPTRDVRLLHVLVAAGFGLSVGLALASAIRTYFGTVVGSRLSNATVLMFFNHLQHLRLQFFDEHRVGEIMSRFQDVRSSLGAVSAVIGVVLSSGMNLIIVPPLLLILDARLALVAMATMPFSIALTYGSARWLRRFWKRSAEAAADLNAAQVEALSHIRTVKTLAIEQEVFRRVRGEMEEAMNLQLKANGLSQIFGMLNGIIAAVGAAILLWYGWGLILNGSLTLGGFMAFSAYSAYLYQPIKQWVSLVSGFQLTAVRLGRMFEYLDAPVEQNPENAYMQSERPARRQSGEIVFRNVTYGYAPETPVLRDVSIAFPPGSVTALVGPSGAGKSTMLRLLCGLDQPQHGTIVIDGMSLDRYDLRDLRREIGVVSQDAALFQGTLWDNLTLGTSMPDRSDVEEVVSICGLTDTIAQLPSGYDTSIAEWGATLSAGQKQRIVLARVLLREPSILLLDEATANIDLSTEAAILSALFKRVEQRTLIMVTHRVVTAALASQICVLENGGIVGLGSHADLMTSCSVYRSAHETARTVAEPRHLRMVPVSGLP